MRPDGRRGAVDWIAAAHETESEAGSQAIEAWLGRRAASPGDDRWPEVLDRLRQDLGRLVSHPVIRHDGACQAILGRLDATSGFAEIDAAMQAIGQRVDVLLAAGAAPRPEVPPAAAAKPEARPPAAGRLQSLWGFLRL